MKVTSLSDFVDFTDERFGRSAVLSSNQAALFLYCFKPGQEMPDHTHPFSAEYLLVLEGEAVISMDVESVLAGVHQAVLIPPEAVHAISNAGSAPLVIASFMSPRP